MPPLTNVSCRKCGRCLTTQQGLKSHLTQCPDCLKAFREALAIAVAAAENVSPAEGLSEEDLQLFDTFELGVDGECHGSDGAGDPMDVDLDPPNPQQGHHRRATVEEVADEDDGRLPHKPWVEEHPQSAGRTYGRSETYFGQLHREKQAAGEHQWMPFESEEEWELAHWLMTSGLAQKDIDRYLKLKIVSQIRIFYHCHHHSHADDRPVSARASHSPVHTFSTRR